MYPNGRIAPFLGANLWDRLVLWYQNSLLRELIQWVDQTLFGVNFTTYENLSISAETGGVVKNVVLGLLFGSVFAAILMSYTRTVQGGLVRSLLKRACFSRETAVTLREVGAFRNPSIRRELASGGALTKLLCRVPYAAEGVEEASVEGAETVEDATETETSEAAESPKNATRVAISEEIDFLRDRFYIPEELKYKAEARYDSRGAGKLALLLTVLVSIVGCVLICRLLPLLLQLIDWLFSVLG